MKGGETITGEGVDGGMVSDVRSVKSAVVKSP